MKQKTKERLWVTVLIVALLFGSLMAGGATGMEVYYNASEEFHDSDGYNYADVQSNSYGDTRLFSSNEDDPVSARQVTTYSFAYNDSKTVGGNAHHPTSRNHTITVEIYDTPGNGASIRDPFGYDNHDDESLDQAVEDAISLLFEFASSVTNLPLPDPFGLATLSSDGSDLTVDRTSQKVVFTYNAIPDYQGADWLVRTNTPVKTGWYRVNVNNRASMGYLICDSNSCFYSEFDKSDQFHAADFEVYR